MASAHFYGSFTLSPSSAYLYN